MAFVTSFLLQMVAFSSLSSIGWWVVRKLRAPLCSRFLVTLWVLSLDTRLSGFYCCKWEIRIWFFFRLVALSPCCFTYLSIHIFIHSSIITSRNTFLHIQEQVSYLFSPSTLFLKLDLWSLGIWPCFSLYWDWSSLLSLSRPINIIITAFSFSTHQYHHLSIVMFISW